MSDYTLLCFYLTLTNVIAYVLFWFDKRLARENSSFRVPEATLLLFCLLGGSPAGYLAQQHFRHKTSKVSFQKRFWSVVLLQLLFLASLGADMAGLIKLEELVN